MSVAVDNAPYQQPLYPHALTVCHVTTAALVNRHHVAVPVIVLINEICRCIQKRNVGVSISVTVVTMSSVLAEKPRDNHYCLETFIRINIGRKLVQCQVTNVHLQMHTFYTP